MIEADVTQQQQLAGMLREYATPFIEHFALESVCISMADLVTELTEHGLQ